VNGFNGNKKLVGGQDSVARLKVKTQYLERQEQIHGDPTYDKQFNSKYNAPTDWLG
jgi:hypothetical protein